MRHSGQKIYCFHSFIKNDKIQCVSRGLVQIVERTHGVREVSRAVLLPPTKMKHLNIKIFGQVQGVGFRASAKKKAEELQITGFAGNEPEGTVFIEIEGEKENLEKFLNWCKGGTIFARVDKIEFEYSLKLKNYSSFQIY